MTSLSTPLLNHDLDLKAFEEIFLLQKIHLLKRVGLLEEDLSELWAEKHDPGVIFQSLVQYVSHSNVSLSMATWEFFLFWSKKFPSQALRDERYRLLSKESDFSWQFDILSMIFQHFGSCNSLVIPWWVVVLKGSCFHECKSLESVTFENGSRLERIERKAFYCSGLKSIVIPPSTIVLDESSFSGCKSLETVVFEDSCQLGRIDVSDVFRLRF
jgi:hypothetical protein